MSWCRWSSELENGQNTSDLYIYDSVYDCITVHVRGRRYANYADAPPQPNWAIMQESIERWMRMSKDHQDWLDKNGVWEPLPDEYAGKNYDFTDIQELKEFLTQARKDHIMFPEYVFEIVEEGLDNGEQV